MDAFMAAFLKIVSEIRVMDVIDVAIVAFVLYKVLQFIQETRAEQLLKGLLILLIATKLSDVLKLYTTYWILKNTVTLGMIALIIVFQPELRRGLEYIGRGKFISKSFTEIDKEKAIQITAAILKAVEYFSKYNIGSLIIIERETAIGEIIETGTKLNAEISQELLINIFNVNAPLHDGAVIIRGDKILAAGCVLPLTPNNSLSRELGTRHRAGIGITENSDSVAIIVSEETGAISISIDGKLSRFLDVKSVERIILNVYLNHKEDNKAIMPLIKKIWRHGNE